MVAASSRTEVPNTSFLDVRDCKNKEMVLTCWILRRHMAAEAQRPSPLQRPASPRLAAQSRKISSILCHCQP
eukprot:897390-Pelagomonas_calceolata.AAC.1